MPAPSSALKPMESPSQSLDLSPTLCQSIEVLTKHDNDCGGKGTCAPAWGFAQRFRAEIMMGLFIMCYYMTYSTVQNLLIEKVCVHRFNYSLSACKGRVNSSVELRTQEQAAQLLMYHQIIASIPAVFVSIFMGSWSDMYGRKMPIVLPAIGKILCCALYLLNYYFFVEWPPEMLLLASIPAGLTGDLPGFLLGLYGFIRDTSPLSVLSTQVSFIDGVQSLMSNLGPIVGQQLFVRYGYPPVFFCCAALLMLLVIYGCFSVKDDAGHFRTASARTAALAFFDPRGFANCVKTAFKFRADHKRAYIICVMVSSCVIFFCTNGFAEIVYLYTRAKFQWDISLVSYFSLLMQSCAGIGMLILVPLAIRYLQITDTVIGIIGQLGCIGFHLGISLAQNTETMFGVAVLNLIAQISIVTLTSIVSKCVEVDEIGKITAVFAVLQAVVSVMGQTLSTQIYLATLSIFIGAFFAFTAALFLIPLVIFGWMHYHMEKNRPILEVRPNSIN